MQYWRGLLLLALALSSCWAQSWSIGGAAGFGFYKDATITNPSGSADAGFGPRIALSAVASEDILDHFGGEIRYSFLDGDSELKSGGREANMDAAAHALSYEILAYGAGRHARLRPFAAAGGGFKYYTGTGKEDPFQPLSDFAFLTHTNQIEGLVSFGGGVKYSVAEHWIARLDFRDLATPFPGKVIAPAPGAKVHGWLHDFVVMAGIDWKIR